MSKVIVSSKSMYNALLKHMDSDRLDSGIVTIEINKNKLMFHDIRYWLDIESNGDCKIEVTMREIRTLFHVVNAIPEQPITVDFKTSNNGIEIYNILI